MRFVFELLVIFIFGATAYTCIEILWRKYTHWTMAFAGGFCFLLLYLFHIAMPDIDIILRCIIGAIAISGIELAVGCVVNLKLGWGVWDYSHLRFNFLGQISLFYSFLWFILAIISDMLAWVFTQKIFI